MTFAISFRVLSAWWGSRGSRNVTVTKPSQIHRSRNSAQDSFKPVSRAYLARQGYGRGGGAYTAEPDHPSTVLPPPAQGHGSLSRAVLGPLFAPAGTTCQPNSTGYLLEGVLFFDRDLKREVPGDTVNVDERPDLVPLLKPYRSRQNGHNLR